VPAVCSILSSIACHPPNLSPLLMPTLLFKCLLWLYFMRWLCLLLTAVRRRLPHWFLLMVLLEGLGNEVA
jgi:hypothetical protein